VYFVNLSAFKAYDVRGVYPTELDEELASKVAKAFAHHMRVEKIVVGMDARESSPAIHDAILKALSSMGVDVYDIGVCNTPLLNYTVVAKGFAAGIMISASHSTKEYNALKLIKHGVQLSIPGELEQIKTLVENNVEIHPVKNELGNVFTLHVLNDYLAELEERFMKVKGLKIVVDYGNGMGSVTAKHLFEKLGLEIHALNEKVDCTFPVHPANPAEEENLKQLRESVVLESADCGIAFDGDADRSFLIDDKGRIIYPDIMTALLAPSELEGRSEKRIYYDLRFSKVVPEVIAANRGIPIIMRVGNPFYKEKLKREGGVFAAELSGHVMFQDHYCIDDGLYAALKVLKVMVEKQEKLSDLIEPLLKYPSTPELNFKVDDADAVLKRVKSAFTGGRSIELDGVYMIYPDWWFNLRKSNTEPIVRLRLEANSKDLLERMKKKLVDLIK
jgi:phosphomannomutase